MLLFKYCTTLDLIAQPADLQLLMDNRPLLSFLPVCKGFACAAASTSLLCRYYTILYDNICQYLNQQYALCHDQYTASIRPVRLQSWYSNKRTKY
jgi:hypothetical protein